MKVSVLMSIYHKEEARYFNRSMQSIWNDQSVKPNEIILVQDGKLTNELYHAIVEWEKKLGRVFKTIPLEINRGLGDALNIGLKCCKYEIIARMDTDDIASKDRFEKQLNVIKNSNIDICGTWVSEFDEVENEIISYRKVPEKHEDIMSFFKIRNAINHPSVMYKKSVVMKAGGYKNMMWFEDYYLWVRIMLNGAIFYNIQEPLVNMRAGYGQLERRRGIKYALEEVSFQKELLNIGFINRRQFIMNNIIRITARILPNNYLKSIYALIREM